MRYKCAAQPFRYPAQLTAVFLLLSSCVLIRGSFDGLDCDGEDEGSGSGEEEQEWWAENITNGTELCSGVMEFNITSDVVFSQPQESASSNLPCSEYNYTYERCTVHDYITLTTDKVSYIDAHSVIVTSVEPNATRNFDRLYYKLCYSLFGSSEGSDVVVECTSNGTTMVSEYKWPESGEVVLTVHVYTSASFNDSNFLDCGMAKVTVASDYGLNLTVKLVNEPHALEEGIQPYSRMRKGGGGKDTDNDDKPLFILGNVTFATVAELWSEITEGVTYYYSFVVTGPSSEEGVCSHHSNWTKEFLEVGEYSYTIHAIAKLDNIEAHHANVSGGFELLKGLSDPMMQVGSNNSVKVGSRELSIAAEGSTPISVCWFQIKIQAKDIDPTDSTYASSAKDVPPLPPEDHNIKENRSALPMEDCIVLYENSMVFRENRTYNVVGTFRYVAHFHNGASQVKKNFTFHVYSSTSPTLVASSATAVVILAVLIAVVVVIVALVAGGYIPYRRYKNRMTETADFRFVDLSENGRVWDRFKLKANQFMDYFRTKRHNEKIGLVNLGAVPMSEERRLFYGTNTLTQFAPYETL